MGLDTVELVIAIESTFDLVIPDDRAEKLETIGDAYRFILNRLEFPESPGPCLSAGAFYRLRRTLIRLVGTPRAEVHPEARLDTLLVRSRPPPGLAADWANRWDGGFPRSSVRPGSRPPPDSPRSPWPHLRGRAAHPEFPGAAAGPLPPLPPGDLS